MNVLFASSRFNVTFKKLKFRYWVSFYFQGSLKHFATIQTNQYPNITGYQMDRELIEYPTEPTQIVLSPTNFLVIYRVEDEYYSIPYNEQIIPLVWISAYLWTHGISYKFYSGQRKWIPRAIPWTHPNDVRTWFKSKFPNAALSPELHKFIHVK